MTGALIIAGFASVGVAVAALRRRRRSSEPAPALDDFLAVIDDAFRSIGEEAPAGHERVEREQIHRSFVVLTAQGLDGLQMTFDVGADGIDVHAIGPEVASFGNRDLRERREFVVEHLARLLTSRVEVGPRRRSKSGCELRFIDEAGETFGRNVYFNTDYRKSSNPTGPLFPPGIQRKIPDTLD